MWWNIPLSREWFSDRFFCGEWRVLSAWRYGGGHEGHLRGRVGGEEGKMERGPRRKFREVAGKIWGLNFST